MNGDHAHGAVHGSGGGDGHAHGGAGSDARALRIALGLIVGFMVFEVAAAFWAGSLALLADAGHMLTDGAALATALWAIRLAARPVTATWSFGLKRAEILSAAVNGVTLWRSPASSTWRRSVGSSPPGKSAARWCSSSRWSAWW